MQACVGGVAGVGHGYDKHGVHAVLFEESSLLHSLHFALPFFILFSSSSSFFVVLGIDLRTFALSYLTSLLKF